MTRTTDCTICPPAVLVSCLQICSPLLTLDISNIIYLHMKDLTRKTNVPSCPTPKAPSMGHSMSHTLGLQLPPSDLLQTIH